MPEVWFAVPGDPETLTGGYIYAKRLTAALRGRGWTVHALRLPGGFPNPSTEDLAETQRLLGGLPSRATVLIDGLAFGAFTPAVLANLDLDIVALVHHPLARETGLTASAAQISASREREALRAARAVVATSPHTASVLATDYGVPQYKLSVAPPGTERRPRAPGHSHASSLLTVATVTPRKGHDLLVAALARIKNLTWTSTIAGSLERAPDTAAALRAQIAYSGLASRIALTGELPDDALAKLYAGADIFVLPSRYEGYGMVFADALAYGLPIVGCAAGAVVDTVPQNAAILVPVDDAEALADALRDLLTNANLRSSMAVAAWSAGQALPRWDDTAAIVARALAG